MQCHLFTPIAASAMLTLFAAAGSLMRASELVDADVIASGLKTGAQFGEIKDAVLEIRSGDMGMLLLDPDTVLFGIGDDFKCLPWTVSTVVLGDISVMPTSTRWPTARSCRTI